MNDPNAKFFCHDCYPVPEYRKTCGNNWIYAVIATRCMYILGENLQKFKKAIWFFCISGASTSNLSDEQFHWERSNKIMDTTD